jgi:putative spermidine/putrescine transport system substrate-binding protein
MRFNASRTCSNGLVAAVVIALIVPQPALARVEKTGKGEGAVDIVAWPGYIERGDRQELPATDFEKDWLQGQCQDRYFRRNGRADERRRLRLVTASGDAIRLIAGGRVQEVNPADPELQEHRPAPPSALALNGKHFGVPYQWGYNALAYNTNVFKTPPKSWEVVFKEMQLPDGNRTRAAQALDGPIYIADAALFLMYSKPDLGIKNPYELNEDQYKEALQLLREQRKLVGRYWHDAMVQIEDFKNEGVVASSSWGFQVNLLQGETRPIASVVPQEGATGWADTTMMHVTAKHPNCAYLWMEHSLNVKLQGDLASWFGSVPVVPAACKGNKLLGEKGCETNGMNEFDKIWFWRTPVANCGGKACVPYYRWVTDYIAILGGR